jgi:hypothetical protein
MFVIAAGGPSANGRPPPVTFRPAKSKADEG